MLDLNLKIVWGNFRFVLVEMAWLCAQGDRYRDVPHPRSTSGTCAARNIYCTRSNAPNEAGSSIHYHNQRSYCNYYNRTLHCTSSTSMSSIHSASWWQSAVYRAFSFSWGISVTAWRSCHWKSVVTVLSGLPSERIAELASLHLCDTHGNRSRKRSGFLVVYENLSENLIYICTFLDLVYCKYMIYMSVYI